jgi:hypothetical protein
MAVVAVPGFALPDLFLRGLRAVFVAESAMKYYATLR